jgi:spermidine/putrescine transport system substrate-binding protein
MNRLFVSLFVLALTLSAAAAETKTLHLFAMSDYLPEEVIKSFEKKFNAKVKYDNFSNNEELLAKFQSGAKGYDVIIPSDYMVKALTEGGYLSDLDHSKIPNLKNIAKEFVDAPFDPNNKHTVPYTWGTTGLVYNSKLIKETITSWKQLEDPKYKGKIALLDDSREVFGAMLHTTGHSSNSTKSEDLKAAQSELIKIKPAVRLFSSDPKQHVLSGDIWIAHIYSGDAFQINKKKPELKYVVPTEGATVWVDTLAIPKTAKNPELAHEFLTFI